MEKKSAMNIDIIKNLVIFMRAKTNQPNSINTPVPVEEYMSTHEMLAKIVMETKNELPALSRQLESVKDAIFIQTRNYANVTYFFVNPYSYGKAIGILAAMIDEGNDPTHDIWNLVHPRIKSISEKLYKDGSYANATCDAFIEINVRVKNLFSKLKPDAIKIPDGDAVMKTVFSANSPMVKFCDISSETGFNIQKGFMEMLAGAMSALRNPKSHENISINKENAMRQIMFASMLMYKIDEAIIYSRIQE